MSLNLLNRTDKDRILSICSPNHGTKLARARARTHACALARTPRNMHASESESELFTGDTSKDNHSPGPVFREVSP